MDRERVERRTDAHAVGPHWAENVALAYLLRRGWRLRHRNFRVRSGEIDLVMLDGSTLVFVEVRQRASERFGGASASIDARKLRRIRGAARHYLARHAAGQDLALRIDAVLVLGDERRHAIQLLSDVR